MCRNNNTWSPCYDEKGGRFFILIDRIVENRVLKFVQACSFKQSIQLHSDVQPVLLANGGKKSILTATLVFARYFLLTDARISLQKTEHREISPKNLFFIFLLVA